MGPGPYLTNHFAPVMAETKGRDPSVTGNGILGQKLNNSLEPV